MIIGSQAILASWPDAPALLRASGEIDAYPANAPAWEAAKHVEASEEINALFGYLSLFHETHGFYIDGVDDTTAMLPQDWRSRQVVRAVVCDGRIVRAIAPSPEDIAISKLCRADPPDIDYVRELHAARPLNRAAMQRLIEGLAAAPEVRARAAKLVSDLQPNPRML